MSNGIDAVRPGDVLDGPTIDHAVNLNGPTHIPMHRELLDTAKDYLRQAGIHFKYAALQLVNNDAVILMGVSETAILPVCAYDNGEIVNLL